MDRFGYQLFQPTDAACDSAWPPSAVTRHRHPRDGPPDSSGPTTRLERMAFAALEPTGAPRTWHVGGPREDARMSNHAHGIHHSIDYVELPVNDLAAAQAFYGSAFGWEFVAYGPGYAGIRTAAESGGDEAGGLRLAEADGVSRGGPFVLLYSADLDATLAAVKSAGGEVVEGPYEFPGGRRFHFLDPSGNQLGVWATS